MFPANTLVVFHVSFTSLTRKQKCLLQKTQVLVGKNSFPPSPIKYVEDIQVNFLSPEILQETSFFSDAQFCSKLLSDQIEDIQVNFLSPQILQETFFSDAQFCSKLSDQIEDIET